MEPREDVMNGAISMPLTEITAQTTSVTSVSSEIAVSLRGLTKSFGGATALDPTDLDIRKGEFFSLLGPSGCGKTTLLRMIGGFEQPSAGELRIAGQAMQGTQPYDRRTNMVFQHGALFPHLSVAQNIAFGLEMSRQPKEVIARRVSEALDLVRLAGFGERKIDQLSGGQRQRVALARALVNDPEVLLLDEPLGALDLKLRLQMQDELKRLHRQIGGTFIFVTHDQGEAISMSDRIAVMSRGRIQQVGTPREIYERPANRFVAEFMGHSNFFTGTVVRRETDGSGVVSIRGTPFPSRIPATFKDGDAVFVALRFERIEVLPVGEASDGMPGTLVEETYLGPTLQRKVEVPGLGVLVSDAANNGWAVPIGQGVPVRLRWTLDSATVLPV